MSSPFRTHLLAQLDPVGVLGLCEPPPLPPSPLERRFMRGMAQMAQIYPRDAKFGQRRPCRKCVK
jgi:hypothetical protein